MTLAEIKETSCDVISRVVGRGMVKRMAAKLTLGVSLERPGIKCVNSWG